MSSFLSIIKTIGGVALGVEHAVAPIAKLIPGISGPATVIDDVFARVQTAIAGHEAINPVQGQGPAKSAAVVQDFEAGLAFTQMVLAMKGEKLSYDAAALQTAISAQVQAFNAFAAVKASFKIVPV